MPFTIEWELFFASAIISKHIEYDLAMDKILLSLF